MTFEIDAFALFLAIFALAAAGAFVAGYADGASGRTLTIRSTCDLDGRERGMLRPGWYTIQARP